MAIDGTGGPVVAGHFSGRLNLGGGAFLSTRSGAGMSGLVGFFSESGT